MTKRIAVLLALFMSLTVGFGDSCHSLLDPKTTQVTSWADKGIMPDLNSGRWVMKGGPTKANFCKSGLPGPKANWSKKFPFLKFEKSNADFSNFITGEVPASSVKLPLGPEVIKAPLGQRILGGGN